MRRQLFVAIVAVHAAFLLAWAGALEWGRATGTTIRLDVVERDPRDLLRGDYITLSYEISTLPPAALESAAAIPPGGRVWVVLEPDGPTWRVAAAAPSREALALQPGQRLITGTVRSERRDSGPRVDYGIERFYVPEGKGTPPAGRMQAEVALSTDGQPQLLRLVVDGRPYP